MASLRSRNNNWRQERLSFMAQRRLEQQMNDSYFRARNRDEGRPAMEAPSKGKAKGKGKETAKNNSERGDCTPWTTRRPLFNWRFVRISSTNQTRKAKERDDHTEIRKVIEKVAGKSQSGTAKRLPCIKFNRGSCPKREMHVIVGVFSNVQNSKLQRVQVRRQQTHR